MMKGITFGNKHSYRDWGLIFTSKSIGLPDPKLETVDVAGMDGELDLTETLTDDVKFTNRKLQFTFTIIQSVSTWYTVLSNISNYLHGKKLRVILDEDKAYYYMARCSVNQFKTDKRTATIVIDCDAEPYKVRLNQNGDWIWDTFSFVDGVIFNGEYTVNGTVVAYLANEKRIESPEFTCSAPMTVTFEGKSYSLPKGTTTILEIRLKEGTNILTFTGHGTVKIYYKGGSL